MANAAKVCQIPNASTIKYALDRKKDIFRRRSDNKKFYIREIFDSDEETEAESDETKSETESDETKSETDESETDCSDVEEDKISNLDFESDSEPDAEIVWESDSEPESEPEATILDHPQNQNQNQIENKLYQFFFVFFGLNLFCSLALFILFCFLSKKEDDRDQRKTDNTNWWASCE